MYMAETDGDTGPDGPEGDSEDSKEEEDDGGGDDDLGDIVADFPVCFASVAIHSATNLLSFPGFCVDNEASDW